MSYIRTCQRLPNGSTSRAYAYTHSEDKLVHISVDPKAVTHRARQDPYYTNKGEEIRLTPAEMDYMAQEWMRQRKFDDKDIPVASQHRHHRNERQERIELAHVANPGFRMTVMANTDGTYTMKDARGKVVQKVLTPDEAIRYLCNVLQNETRPRKR